MKKMLKIGLLGLGIVGAATLTGVAMENIGNKLILAVDIALAGYVMYKIIIKEK